jgi:hypothetical protein
VRQAKLEIGALDAARAMPSNFHPAWVEHDRPSRPPPQPKATSQALARPPGPSHREDS